MEFEWDDSKDAKNRRKHGVSFEVAKHVFDDYNRIEWVDVEHSTEEEERYATIGRAEGILFVVYAERESGQVIRLISARVASAQERRWYYAGQDPF